jgi:hypothetical protein
VRLNRSEALLDRNVRWEWGGESLAVPRMASVHSSFTSASICHLVASVAWRCLVGIFD